VVSGGVRRTSKSTVHAACHRHALPATTVHMAQGNIGDRAVASTGASTVICALEGLHPNCRLLVTGH
jgi:hypothetical protein